MTTHVLENGSRFQFAQFERTPLVLGVSWSTQALSLLAFDPVQGAGPYVDVPFRELGAHKMPMGYCELDDGMVFTTPQLFLAALERGLSELVEMLGADEIRRIAFITGNVQQHGVGFLRSSFPQAVRALDPSRPLLGQLESSFSHEQWPIWKSAHTDAECALLTEALGDPRRVAEETGSEATRRFSLPLWLAFATRHPKAYAETAQLTQFSGFVTALFASGNGPLELGNGLGSNAITHRGTYSEPLMSAAERVAPGLRGKLPTVTHSLDVVGTISPYFSERFGFSADTQILPFTGDNPESALGTGLYSSAQEQAAYSFGTSLTKFRVVDSSVTHVTSGQGHVFGSVTGGHLMLVCHANGMGLADALRQELQLSWPQMRELLNSTSAGNEGVWGLLLPEIECTPPTRRPIQVLTESARYAADAAVRYRALCESQACLIALSAELPGDPSEIIATGGASGDRAFLQVVADVTQKRILPSEAQDSATLGSALRAARLTDPELDFATLCKQFCQVGDVIEPQVGPERYRAQLDWVAAQLKAEA